MTPKKKKGSGVRGQGSEKDQGRRRTSASSAEPSSVFACGPHPMLHAVARIAKRFEIPCQVSVEAEMGCGFGACMGCVIPTKQSAVSSQPSAEDRIADSGQPTAYKLCCKDGPVFDAQEIAW